MTQQTEPLPTNTMYSNALAQMQTELVGQKARNAALWAEVERLQQENARLASENARLSASGRNS